MEPAQVSLVRFDEVGDDFFFTVAPSRASSLDAARRLEIRRYAQRAAGGRLPAVSAATAQQAGCGAAWVSAWTEAGHDPATAMIHVDLADHAATFEPE